MRTNRTLRTAAIIAAALAVAANPAVQDVFTRDGVGQHGIDYERSAQNRVLAEAAAQQVPISCIAGFAGPYPCENVDIIAIATVPQIGAALGSDVWGWVDPETGREIAVPTTTLGAAFVDITSVDEGSEPIVLGRMQIGQNDDSVLWRDVKVRENTAYVVSEHSGTHMYVFDLERLREFNSDQGFFEPDFIYEGFTSAHNIEMHEEGGFAYAVGTGGDDCNGGLHMIDVSNRLEPTFAGCFSEDGYTHDVQCEFYRGPHEKYQGKEICFASNEDTVTIVDVTNKDNPRMLSRTTYPTATYTHQGWLTEDHRWFIFGDELDEATGRLLTTRTYIMSVEDLVEPGEVLMYEHPETAIDHNIYIKDGLVYQANYTAGLRVFDFTEEMLQAGQLQQVGFLDVDPGPEAPAFAGAWTAYPFFPTGKIVMNSFDNGMFVLRLTNQPVQEPAPEPEPEPEPAPEPDPEPAPDPEAEDDPEVSPASEPLPATGGGLVLAGLALAATAVRRRR